MNLTSHLKQEATFEGELSICSAAVGHCAGTCKVEARGQVQNNRNGGIATSRTRDGLVNASRLASYEADADIVADPAFKNLVNLISGLPWDRGERLSFRGVPDKLVPHDCGPAPTSKVGHGRYNRIGVAMLYLSDSLDGMYLEVGEKSLLVQKFRVPFATMKIAAVSQLPNEHDVNQALFYAELRERDATLNPDDPGGYRFSQLLSDEFQKRFDGMIVRSAKGPFCNIVIFKPDPRWSEWTMGAPRLVAAP